MEFIGASGRTFIEKFASFTGRRVTDLIDDVETYNKDFYAYGNEVYAKLETRVAHWANFLDQGWFARRMDYPLIVASQFDVVIDLGFSVPYAFTVPQLRDSMSGKFLFVDRESSTLDFYNTLVNLEGWTRHDLPAEVLIADIEKEDGLDLLSKALHSTGAKSVLIVGSEVLEHLDDSAQVMRWLSHLCRPNADLYCSYYLTLPIGAKIPSHAIEFSSSTKATEWVKQYLPNHTAFTLAPASLDSAHPQSSYSLYCALGNNKQN